MSAFVEKKKRHILLDTFDAPADICFLAASPERQLQVNHLEDPAARTERPGQLFHGRARLGTDHPGIGDDASYHGAEPSFCLFTAPGNHLVIYT